MLAWFLNLYCVLRLGHKWLGEKEDKTKSCKHCKIEVDRCDSDGHLFKLVHYRYPNNSESYDKIICIRCKHEMDQKLVQRVTSSNWFWEEIEPGLLVQHILHDKEEIRVRKWPLI